MKLKKWMPLIIAGLVALAIAASLISWGLSQQTSYERQAENQAAENARHADYDVRYRCDSLPPLDKRNCSIEARREQRRYQRDEQNLYAQKTSAFWTFLMGAAALIGMILSSVGVWLVYTTFGETRRGNLIAHKANARATLRAIANREETAEALAAANKSADAAAGYVEIAQDTAYRQLRAYISVEDVRIELIADTIVSGKLTIRNAGATPAAIALFLMGWIDKHPLSASPAEAPPPVKYAFHGPYINAKSREAVDWHYPLPFMVPEEIAKPAIEGMLAHPINTTLYLYGRVEFVDFKRHQRVLHFAFRTNEPPKMHEPCEMVACMWGHEYEDRGEKAEHGSAPR